MTPIDGPPTEESMRSPRRVNLLGGFSIPAALWYAVFTVGPLVAMFWISLLDWPGLIADNEFVAFDNYQRMWSDARFWQATRNSITQLLFVIPIMIPLAFMLGYYLSLKPVGHRILSVMFFTPGLISITAKALVFFGLFAPNGGVNGLLDIAGAEDFTRAWTANLDTALYTVIAVDLWSGIGWTAVLFAARLTAMPSEVYEAASLDGAGHVRKMWSIAFPMTKDFVGVMTMMQFLWTLFNSAAIVLLLTRGGPAGRSTTLSYLVYERAFLGSDVGYSQAIGVVLFFIGVIGLAIIRRFIRQDY